MEPGTRQLFVPHAGTKRNAWECGECNFPQSVIETFSKIFNVVLTCTFDPVD